MSEAEHPIRRRADHEVTLDDVRQLMGASTPHFALQIRNRIARLIAELPAGHPARVEGEREIARLTRLGYTGEVRGVEGGPEPPPPPAPGQPGGGPGGGGRGGPPAAPVPVGAAGAGVLEGHPRVAPQRRR